MSSSFRIRPRFAHPMDAGPDAARAQIFHALAAQSPGLEVRNFPGYLGLHFPETERRLWTPRLALHFQATPAGTTLVEGRYGPEAELWSLFLYGYLVVGSLGIFSGILGGAQRAIGATPWGLWICGAMAGLAALLYLAAQLGQKLGAWQTFQLHHAYQTATGRPAEIE